jgi:hypothetical protein
MGGSRMCKRLLPKTAYGSDMSLIREAIEDVLKKF